MRRSADDAGHVLVFVVVLMGAIAACLGLVVDGGQMLSDQNRAATLAHEAARAGARELDHTAYRQGDIVVDAQAAQRAAHDYLSAAGATGDVEARSDSVTVIARIPYSTAILPLRNGSAEARASAEAISR